MYLNKRGFDWDRLIKEYGVLGTTPSSQLDNGEGKIIPYSYRILTPIFWQSKQVTFQCRDYTDKQILKYMACPKLREIIHHKHIIYPQPKTRKGIIVEGTFDVWKLGKGSHAVLGIEYTREQVRIIANAFDEVMILFDPEPQATVQANKLKQELLFRGVKAHVYTDLDTDPGDLSEDDAKHLVNELI